MKKLILLIALMYAGIVYGQYETVEAVPNPKTENGGYVSNPDFILDQTTVDQLNEILSDLEENDRFQVAVVCLRSIGDNVPKDFSTELAVKWGIGEKTRDNGLLILLVLDQHRIEFETGYGTESILTDLLTQQIQQEYMLPYFKQNNYDAGMLAGIKAVRDALQGKVLEENTQIESDFSKENAQEYARRRKEQERKFLIVFVSWHLLGVALYLIVILVVRYQQDPYKKYNIIKNFGLWFWAILFPLTHIFLVLLSKKLMSRYRNLVRFSGRTNRIMHKLVEAEEDEFLSMGQQAEEIVKSVDYDVWVTDEKDDYCILSYRPLLTKYTPCPKCKYRTYHKEYDKITISPSYTSAGQGEKKYACTNCNHVDHTKFTIPRLQRSNRTSGGFWIGGIGGAGSSGGGSWGGGGSFGGGSFGGGGSGSSW